MKFANNNKKKDNFWSHSRLNYIIPENISKDYSKNGIMEENHFDKVTVSKSTLGYGQRTFDYLG